jgi:hypothetical protein
MDNGGELFQTFFHGIIVRFHLDFSAFSGFVFNCFKLDRMPGVPGRDIHVTLNLNPC